LKARESERVKRLNPHEDKINMIDQLIAFLGSNAAKPVVKKQTDFNAENFAKPGMTLFKKDDDNDNWLFGDRTKKKTPQPKKSETEAKPPQQEKTVKDPPLKSIPTFRLAQFDLVEVPVPKKQSEVSDTLTALKLKKEYFLSFRKTQAQVDAELDAEDAAKEAAAAAKAAAEPQQEETVDETPAEEETTEE